MTVHESAESVTMAIAGDHLSYEESFELTKAAIRAAADPLAEALANLEGHVVGMNYQVDRYGYRIVQQARAALAEYRRDR